MLERAYIVGWALLTLYWTHLQVTTVASPMSNEAWGTGITIVFYAIASLLWAVPMLLVGGLIYLVVRWIARG
jgi:hypothetical protein